MSEGAKKQTGGGDASGAPAPSGGARRPPSHALPWYQSKLWVGLLVPATAALFTFSQWAMEEVRRGHEHEVEHLRYCQAQATDFIDRFTAAESLDTKQYLLALLNALEQVDHHGHDGHEQDDSSTGSNGRQHGACNHGPLLVAMAKLAVDDHQGAAESPSEASAVQETVKEIQERGVPVEVTERRFVQIGATVASVGSDGLVEWAKRLASDEGGAWEVSVYEVANGSTAIAIGPVSVDEARKIKKKWDASKSRPKAADPALITEGKDYVRRIHPPVTPRRPTAAQIAQMDQLPVRPEAAASSGARCRTACEQTARTCADRCASRTLRDRAFDAARCRRSCETTRTSCETECG